MTGPPVNRPPGVSTRLKLTLSYAGFLLLAGALLLAVVWVFLLRYVPDSTITPGPGSHRFGGPAPPFIPNRTDLQRAFVPRAAQALTFLLAFGLLGGWILAGRMLAPLTQITNAARTTANGSLSHRIRMKGHQDEFRELSDTFDSMLERLESHVAEQRRFAANASHELRTPLAISQALLEVARKDPTRDRDELIDRLHTVNQRAIDLTEALLLLSKSDRANLPRDRVDLSLIAEQAAETLLPLAERRRITLTVTGDPAETTGSPELLARMATNLIQNAIVHNLPTNGTVTVHTETQPDTSVLMVENTGHPLPPQLIPTLTEPFQRGTQRTRTDEHAGVGLGLAIVQSITHTHNGTLTLTPRPTGGLLVTVRLPRTVR
ncbi:HAMP domain-containing sensor histidine kinase [Sphaerisporangium rubeum]|uniref:histidine kinase n=1 Tax=Sphaerisporangium rubeum TaxID=321317 RepID=A0A7X0IB78_9ACTN|nr:HAMP domain-containing sensor histidine kinase [Sphaerisporangium rubeum]MBB6472005.1 two-component system sensor histidine kinase VanS [Sphaerisporangium rubeum]